MLENFFFITHHVSASIIYLSNFSINLRERRSSDFFPVLKIFHCLLILLFYEEYREHF